MRQFGTIALNAFMELVRQPVFLLLMTASVSFIVFLSSVYYFGFGDDPTMTKNSVLAVLFLSGLFGSVLSASASVANEIRTGTALTVMSKPVGRVQFLLGKYAGVAGAILVLTFVNGLAVMLASRMAFDAYGQPDKLGMAIFFGLICLGYAGAGFSNYFLRRPFVPDASFALVLMVTVGFIVVNCIDKEGHWQSFGKGMDERLVPAIVLLLFALWMLAGVALACSTRLEMIPTMVVCSGIFLIGLASDYLFGRAADKGSFLASVAYAIFPNWQQLWLADALENGRRIPWSYVGRAFGYFGAYVVAVLSLSLLMFEDRELN